MDLTANQLERYEEDGYLIIRDVLDSREVETFNQAFFKHTDDLHPMPGFEYPAPGRYTLAHSSLKDPDLGFVAEHSGIVGPAAALLDDDPILTAFVVYDRTPGGPGIPGHNDYKRWRPVGSSMNWLFTIVPTCDYDAEHGQLFVAPGSHRLERIYDEGGPTLEVRSAVKPDDDAYIDPELKRGDLLLMNMHCWHKAAPNRSGESRIGFFNKYAAKSCPPATGYYLFDDAAYNVLSQAGKDLIAVHSNKQIGTTRMVLKNQDKYLLLGQDQKMIFPGAKTWQENAIPDWDIGNYIASLHAGMREQVRIETPWASYIDDYDEGDHLCRVYGYEMNPNGFPVAYSGQWLSLDEVRERSRYGYEAKAIEKWLDPTLIRGKGVTQAQARVDQYAY